MSNKTKLIPNHALEMIGKKYGKLTVVSYNRKEHTHIAGKRYFVNCVCDCGAQRVARTDRLKAKTISHCGCGAKKRKRTSSERIVFGRGW